MTPEETEFVDRVGLFFEAVGAPRTMGRIYGRLMISDPPHQSLTELAEALGVSKPAVSTVIRGMREGGMVQRLPASSRRHHYRIAPGGFTGMLRAQIARVRLGAEAAEFGLSVVAPERQEQREMLHELRDFCEFIASDVHEDFMRRWAEYRRDRGAANDG